MPYTSWDTTTISKMGPTIVAGSAKAQGLKAKPTESSQSRPEQPERGTKRHKGWPVVGASSALSRGPNILKLRILVPTGMFPSCPFMWAGIEPYGFSTRITRERCVKPPGPNLIQGGGGNCSCLILWRGTCLGWLSPPNGDSCSTQILTRHCGA
jgi:hypothetical protein